MSTISKTFDTEEPLLSDLLLQIESGKIQLPDFQRGWVWDDERIKRLIASVSLGYPVGALMSMETGSDLHFAPRPFEGVECGRTEPELLLLDGQQRMTSLFLSLKQKNAVATCDDKKKAIKRFYYLDMERCLDDGAERLDAVVSIQENKKITSDFGREIDLDLSDSEKEYEARYFPLNIIFDNELTAQWQMGFQAHYQFAQEFSLFFFKFQNNVLLPLQKYKIPVIKLHKETPKEAVCQVFENVNRGGVSLNVFELLTATFAANNFRLRPDWEKREQKLQSIDDVLHDVSNTDFIASVTLLASYKRSLKKGSAVSCKRKDILNLSLKEYLDNADELMEGLRKAAKFLHAQMIFDTRNLPYQTQLIPLSVICTYLGNRFEEYAVRQKLARWYWCGVLGELYGGANETRYALDVQNVLSWLDGGAEPVTVRDASFDPTRLLSLQTRNSAAYKGIMSLMLAQGSRDFLSGELIQQTNYFDDKIDIHHIFPANYCLQQNLPRSIWNSIVNKTPLSARTNRIIGGKAPSLYLAGLEGGQHKVDSTALDTYLVSHLINPTLLRTDDFENFILDRARAILTQIEKAMGKIISGKDMLQQVLSSQLQ